MRGASGRARGIGGAPRPAAARDRRLSLALVAATTETLSPRRGRGEGRRRLEAAAERLEHAGDGDGGAVLAFAAMICTPVGSPSASRPTGATAAGRSATVASEAQTRRSR